MSPFIVFCLATITWFGAGTYTRLAMDNEEHPMRTVPICVLVALAVTVAIAADNEAGWPAFAGFLLGMPSGIWAAPVLRFILDQSGYLDP